MYLLFFPFQYRYHSDVYIFLKDVIQEMTLSFIAKVHFWANFLLRGWTEILKCDHSNESYWAVLSCGTVYYAVQGGSNFWVRKWNSKVWPFKWKL